MSLVSLLKNRKVCDNVKEAVINDVLVSASSSVVTGSCMSVLRDDASFWMSLCEPEAFLSFHFIREPVIVEKFILKFPVLCLPNSSNPLVPRQILFQGSLDNMRWFDICTMDLPESAKKSPNATWNCVTKSVRVCKYVRVRLGSSNHATSTLALSYIDIQSKIYSPSV